MRYRKLLPWVLALLAVSGCGHKKEPENRFYHLDETVSTAFFEYQVDHVAVTRNYHGLRANPGHRIVVLELTIENTEYYDLSMGRYDFRLQWGEGEEDVAYPQTWYYVEQFPNHYEIPADEEITGQLVFQVPETEEDLFLGYLEVFENDSQGDAHFTQFHVEMNW